MQTESHTEGFFSVLLPAPPASHNLQQQQQEIAEFPQNVGIVWSIMEDEIYGLFFCILENTAIKDALASVEVPCELGG